VEKKSSALSWKQANMKPPALRVGVLLRAGAGACSCACAKQGHFTATEPIPHRGISTLSSKRTTKN